MTEPKLMPKVSQYLTIIPSRVPEQKLHTQLGHAKNAFHFHNTYGGRWGELYEFKDGEWVLLYTIEKPPIVGYRKLYDGSRDYPIYADTRPWKLKDE